MADDPKNDIASCKAGGCCEALFRIKRLGMQQAACMILLKTLSMMMEARYLMLLLHGSCLMVWQ